MVTHSVLICKALSTKTVKLAETMTLCFLCFLFQHPSGKSNSQKFPTGGCGQCAQVCDNAVAPVKPDQNLKACQTCATWIEFDKCPEEKKEKQHKCCWGSSLLTEFALFHIFSAIIGTHAC
jgi:hypothetical protein